MKQWKTKEKALTWEKLRERQVQDSPSKDKLSAHFKSVLGAKVSWIAWEEIGSLLAIMNSFIQQAKKARPGDNSAEAIEDVFTQMNGWRPKFNLASITNRDFKIDIDVSRKSNEAVLQRTVMTDIIDRWQLREMFVYNCEGQWNLPMSYRLPSMARDDVVTLPKPDLAIFFKPEALTGENKVYSPIPKQISSCMRPDGGLKRCFPFVFMEVKKAAHDLESASMANMHSASQALYNIYQWMSQAGHDEIFFEKVRVFSIDLNAKEINVKIHRASVFEDSGLLHYEFDDILSFQGYSRDQACMAIKNILVEYGEKELLGILKATFEEVSRQEAVAKQLEDEHMQSKRKAYPTATASSKKFRPIEGTADSPTNATSSLSASGLDIS